MKQFLFRVILFVSITVAVLLLYYLILEVSNYPDYENTLKLHYFIFFSVRIPYCLLPFMQKSELLLPPFQSYKRFMR